MKGKLCMKKNIANFRAVALLLAALTLLLCGCQASLPVSTTPAETSAETTAAPTTTAPADIFDETDLLAILDEAGEILKENGTVELRDPSYYVRYFFKFNNEILAGCFTQQDDVITVAFSGNDTNQETMLRYGIFLHLLASRYPDRICLIDYDYTPDRNIGFFPILYCYAEYRQAGYDTVLDCYKAVQYAILPPLDNSFYINFDGCIITEYASSTFGGGIRWYEYLPES
jgi:hypothetical protein